MSSKDFKVISGVEVDSYEIITTGSLDRQTLVYDGNSYLPSDIVPIGSIEMWAGTLTPPNGWLLCDGTSYSWNQYTRLRDVIGTSYGGSVSVSWNVPNITSSSTPVIPIGVSAGSSLGSSSKLFNSGSISHSHTYNSSNYGSNTNGYGNHSHNTVDGGQNSHSHTLDPSNWNHFHNSNDQSANHSHNYFRGNSGGANTTNSAHGNHNVSTNSHAHNHATTNDTHSAHTHGYNAFGANHNHNWNTANAQTNAAGDNHNHSVNKQSIYFIIKY